MRFLVFACLVTAGSFGSPAAAEPCPNEWNAYVQARDPSARAEVLSWSDDRRYVAGTQGFWGRYDIMALNLGNPNNWTKDPRSLRMAAHVLAVAVSSWPAITAEYRYGACRALARADELEGKSGRPAARPKVTTKRATPARPRDEEASRMFVRVIVAAERRYPIIEPCEWKDGDAQQAPCNTHNVEQNYRAMAEIVSQLDARKNQFSPQAFAKEREPWAKELNRMVRSCALLSASPHPCNLPDINSRAIKAVPSLRPTITQEAHNPAGEASDCVQVIYSDDFEVEHVSTTQKAAFRNRCSRPVEVSWCTVSDDCRPGYTNLATVPARKDRGFSFEPSVAGSKVAYAACYNGFVRHQGELSKKLLHACR